MTPHAARQRTVSARPGTGRAADAGAKLGGTLTAPAMRAPSLLVATLLLAPAVAVAQPSPDADAQAIRAKILQGARGFMLGDPDTVLAHYARDIVLSYPGIPDMDYATLARSYGELRRRPAGERAATTPTFDEVLVSGDLTWCGCAGRPPSPTPPAARAPAGCATCRCGGASATGSGCSSAACTTASPSATRRPCAEGVGATEMVAS